MMMPPLRPAKSLASLGTLALAMLLASSPAQAQIYRSVDAQGRVSFSDTPPGPEARALAPTTSQAAPASPLPAALRQPAQRFPVTLYSAPDCAPCDSGRQQLRARGIPFTEKTVTTQADITAFGQLGGSQQLPGLRVGQHMLSGYADTEWTRLLDAAGYPEQSALPRSWVPAPASPLAPIAAPTPADAAPAAAAEAPDERLPAAITPPITPDNPAGLRF